MGQPFVGEIRMFAGNFAPAGWAFCQGQILAIADNDVLFQLIGTTYGGDGLNTFALPNLQSRIPLHAGPGFTLAQAAGEESVTLTTAQIPAHSHVPLGNASPGSLPSPANGVWAAQATNVPYSNLAPSVGMDPGAIGQTGGSQPHDNMMPFLVVNFIISLFGVFPTPA
ncbi:MAG TPA: tail fiber protein [Candidatus Angelobacter sp.]|nr:tail fiber protein [Candidatus Angelobacter sp.]